MEEHDDGIDSVLGRWKHLEKIDIEESSFTRDFCATLAKQF